MGVHVYTVALFLHVGVVILTFMIAAILHATINLLVRAETAEVARPLARVVHRLDPLFPILALFIFGFGMWLIGASPKDAKWHFTDGWILTGFITLVVIEGLAGSLLAPHAKKMVKAIEEAPNGPLSSEVRAMTRDPFIWYIAHTATVGFLGVVFVMTNKPSGGVAVLAVVIAVIVGNALARYQLSLAERTQSAAAAEPAAAAAD